jgi:hypothetical protein
LQQKLRGKFASPFIPKAFWNKGELRFIIISCPPVRKLNMIRPEAGDPLTSGLRTAIAQNHQPFLSSCSVGAITESSLFSSRFFLFNEVTAHAV